MPRTRKIPEKVDIAPLIESAMKNDEELSKHIQNLAGPTRRGRQISSTIVFEVANRDLSKIEPYAEDIVDGLNRPESQTRWEVLQTLTLLVDGHAKECMDCIEAAETALFDENSGSLRLAAFVFLCKLGATTEARSREVWPLIDEATQCCHGDIEFGDMLNSLVEFSDGKIDPEVACELAELMKFDAENSTGNLFVKSTAIIDNCKKKSKKK